MNHARQEIDPVDLSGGAICGLLRRPSFGFLLLLEAARPVRSFAPASSRLACGDALGLEAVHFGSRSSLLAFTLSRIILTAPHISCICTNSNVPSKRPIERAGAEFREIGHTPTT